MADQTNPDSSGNSHPENLNCKPGKLQEGLIVWGTSNTFMEAACFALPSWQDPTPQMETQSCSSSFPFITIS